MFERLIDRRNRFYRHFIIEKLRPETMGIGLSQQRGRIAPVEYSISKVVGIQHHVFLGQRCTQVGQIGETAAVHDKAVESIAYRDTPRLGIEHDGTPFLDVARTVEIGMAYTRSGLDNRYLRILTHKIDKAFASPGNHQIDITRSV